MTMQPTIQIRGIVEQASDKSVLIKGTRYYASKFQQNYRELPQAGAAVILDIQVGRGKQTGEPVYYIEDWYEDKSAPPQSKNPAGIPWGENRGLDAQFQNAPQSHQDGAQGFHDDKPVVTRLACLNAAINSALLLGPRVGADHDITPDWVLGLAETYVAWALYGGIDKSTKEEPKASEALWNPEYNPYE